MVCKGYLAVTEKELQKHATQSVAWMACRFDRRGQGLGNLPHQLPKGSLILVDDLQPITNHSPQQVVRQLTELCSRHHPAGLVLDLQRTPTPKARQMVNTVSKMHLPVAVTPEYARELSCPVFLPAPMHIKLQQTLAPWKEREIWLDFPMGHITVIRGKPEKPREYNGAYEWDRFLCCGYAKTGNETYALCRNKTMLPKILQEVGKLDIPKALFLCTEL